MCRAKGSTRRHWQPMACSKLSKTIWSPFWRRCIVWYSQPKCTTIYMRRSTSRYREDMYSLAHIHILIITHPLFFSHSNRNTIVISHGPPRVHSQKSSSALVFFFFFAKKASEDHRTNPQRGFYIIDATDETAVTQQKCHNATTTDRHAT